MPGKTDKQVSDGLIDKQGNVVVDMPYANVSGDVVAASMQLTPEMQRQFQLMMLQFFQKKLTASQMTDSIFAFNVGSGDVHVTQQIQTASVEAQQRRKNILENPEAFSDKPWSSKEFPIRNKLFVGREKYFKQLEQTAAKAAGKPLVSLISGLGGIGKSQLIIEYIYRQNFDESSKRYQFIARLCAANHDSFSKDMQTLATYLGFVVNPNTPIEHVCQEVYGLLNKLGRVFIFIDGADQFNEIKELLPPQDKYKSSSFHCVITSRTNSQEWKNYFRKWKFQLISPEAFNKDDTLSYFEKAFEPAVKSQETYTKENLQKLAKYASYYPLALAQIVAYLNKFNKKITIVDYLQQYKKDISSLEYKPQDDYEHTLLIVFFTTLKRLWEETQSIETLALLCHCALLANGNITDSLLRAVLGDIYSTDLDIKLQVVNQVDVLNSLSLISKNSESIDESSSSSHSVTVEESYTIHQRLQDVLLMWLQGKVKIKEGELKNKLNEIVSVMQSAGITLDDLYIKTLKNLIAYSQSLDKKVYGIWRRINLLSHLKALYTHSENRYFEYKEADKEYNLLVADLLENMASIEYYTGDFYQRCQLLKKGLFIRRMYLGEGDRKTAITYAQLANAYGKVGEFEQKKELLEIALAIQKTCDEAEAKESNDTATTHNNLATVLYTEMYQKNGDSKFLEQAESHLREAIRIQKSIFEDSTKRTTTARMNLANVYGLQGEYGRKKKILGRILDIQREMYDDPGHKAIAATKVNLANAMGQLGDQTTRKKMLEETLVEQKGSLGNEKHLNLVNTLLNLANACGKLNEKDLQKKYFLMALEIQTETLGNEHPITKKMLAKSRKLSYDESAGNPQNSTLMFEDLSSDESRHDRGKSDNSSYSCEKCQGHRHEGTGSDNENSMYSESSDHNDWLVDELQYLCNLCDESTQEAINKFLIFNKSEKFHAKKIKNYFPLIDLIYQKLKEDQKPRQSFLTDTEKDVLIKGLLAICNEAMTLKNQKQMLDKKAINFQPKELQRLLTIKIKDGSNSDLETVFIWFCIDVIKNIKSSSTEKQKKQFNFIVENFKNPAVKLSSNFFDISSAALQQKNIKYKENYLEIELIKNVIKNDYPMTKKRFMFIKDHCFPEKAIRKFEVNFMWLTEVLAKAISRMYSVNVIILTDKCEVKHYKADEKIDEDNTIVIAVHVENRSYQLLNFDPSFEVKGRYKFVEVAQQSHTAEESKEPSAVMQILVKPNEERVVMDKGKGKDERDMGAAGPSSGASMSGAILQRPHSYHDLVRYYQQVNEPEKRYIVQNILQWMNTGKILLTEQHWQDGIAVLALNDGDVSSTWIQKLYDAWRDNLNQPTWIKEALINTIQRLHYFQPAVLSGGGAATLILGMLDWLNNAEELTGNISGDVEDAWYMVIVTMSFLSQTAGLGVGKKLYDKLLKAMTEFNFNTKNIKDPVKKQRLTQLKAALKANRKYLEIKFTRAQKLEARVEVVKQLFNSIVSVGQAVAAGGIGVGALAGAIAAGPGAPAAIIPGIAAFTAGMGAAAASTEQAVRSGINAGLNIHYLSRNAKAHPIRQLFTNNENSDANLLASICKEYLDGPWQDKLKATTKGSDSLLLIQFLFELLVDLDGAAAYGIEPKDILENQLTLLLKAVYQAHAVDQNSSLSKAICGKVIILAQTVAKNYEWNLLPQSFKKESVVTNEGWVSTFEQAGWFKEAERESFAQLLAINENNAKVFYQKNAVSLEVTWGEWYKKDMEIEELALLYQGYKNGDKSKVEALKAKYQAVAASIDLATQRQDAGHASSMLSTHGMQLVMSLINDNDFKKALETENVATASTISDLGDKLEETFNEVQSKMNVAYDKFMSELQTRISSDHSEDSKCKVKGLVEVNLKGARVGRGVLAYGTTVILNADNSNIAGAVSAFSKAIAEIEDQSLTAEQKMMLYKEQERKAGYLLFSHLRENHESLRQASKNIDEASKRVDQASKSIEEIRGMFRNEKDPEMKRDLMEELKQCRQDHDSRLQEYHDRLKEYNNALQDVAKEYEERFQGGESSQPSKTHRSPLSSPKRDPSSSSSSKVESSAQPQLPEAQGESFHPN